MLAMFQDIYTIVKQNANLETKQSFQAYQQAIQEFIKNEDYVDSDT